MLFRFVRCFLGNDYFNQFHPAHRIKEMQTDHAVRRNSAVGQLADRKRGCVRGDDRFRARLHRQLAENLLLDVDLFRSGFDYERDIAQFHRRSRSNDPRATLFRFFFRHQTALHRVSVNLFDVGQTAVEQFAVHVAQNHGHAACAQPLRDTRAHHAGADHGRVRNLLELRFRTPFLIFFRQEKIADQILGRFAFAKIDNRVELQFERFVDWISEAGRDNAERPRPRRFRIGWNRRFPFRW